MRYKVFETRVYARPHRLNIVNKLGRHFARDFSQNSYNSLRPKGSELNKLDPNWLGRAKDGHKCLKGASGSKSTKALFGVH